MKILVINGPGTWLLGREDVRNSGNDTLDDIDLRVREKAADCDIEVDFVRTNYEGEIIESLYRALEEFDGVILNAGGYSYSSYAIAEAIEAVGIPVIEVCPKKERGNLTSVISPYCAGRICGFGSSVYTLAIEAFSEF